MELKMSDGLVLKSEEPQIMTSLSSIFILSRKRKITYVNNATIRRCERRHGLKKLRQSRPECDILRMCSVVE
jgi:hypothetical protein